MVQIHPSFRETGEMAFTGGALASTAAEKESNVCLVTFAKANLFACWHLLSFEIGFVLLSAWTPVHLLSLCGCVICAAANRFAEGPGNICYLVCHLSGSRPSVSFSGNFTSLKK